MHTSEILDPADCTLCRCGTSGATETPFASWFPDYHPEDRIAVVAGNALDTVLVTGGMFLGCTALFYDRLRSRGERFYDYPRHWVMVAGDRDARRMAPAWSWLDVWPDSQWVETAPNRSDLLNHIFRLQINRLFWPETGFAEIGEVLPIHVRRLLESRVKSICYYGAEHPTHTLQLHGDLRKTKEEALERVGEVSHPESQVATETYREVGIAEFLTAQSCFA